MKELEKTKRISISAVLFLLIILMGVLTFKKPEFVFEKNAANTLKKIAQQNYIVTQNDLDEADSKQHTLIDIRSNYEFDKGHIKDAVNIPMHDVFYENSIAFLNGLRDTDKTAILYGENPDQANSAWMLLYQLGYENVKVLSVETVFLNNQLHIKNVAIEKPTLNYAAAIEKTKESPIDKATEESKTVKPLPKKVKPIRKKKKRTPEGGC